jgi:cysteine-rich repeat protein
LWWQAACGNGLLSETEVCDDGNLSYGDGCDNNCL